MGGWDSAAHLVPGARDGHEFVRQQPALPPPLCRRPRRHGDTLQQLRLLLERGEDTEMAPEETAVDPAEGLPSPKCVRQGRGASAVHLLGRRFPQSSLEKHVLTMKG